MNLSPTRNNFTTYHIVLQYLIFPTVSGQALRRISCSGLGTVELLKVGIANPRGGLTNYGFIQEIYFF
jgi:hypothetical protein